MLVVLLVVVLVRSEWSVLVVLLVVVPVVLRSVVRSESVVEVGVVLPCDRHADVSESVAVVVDAIAQVLEG